MQFFCKNFFPFCQTQDFCTFLKSAQNSTSYDTLHAQFRRNFFSTLIGWRYFFRRMKGQIRQKPFNISKNTFLLTSLRISRPNQKHMKHIEFLTKFQNHWTLINNRYINSYSVPLRYSTGDSTIGAGKMSPSQREVSSLAGQVPQQSLISLHK